MIADWIAETIDLDHSLGHHQLVALIVGDGDFDGLRRGCRAEGVLPATQHCRCAVGHSVVGDVCRHIVDAGKFVGGVSQAGVLYQHLITRFELLAVGVGLVADLAVTGACRQHLIDALSVGIHHPYDLATLFQQQGDAPIIMASHSIVREAMVSHTLVADIGI